MKTSLEQYVEEVGTRLTALSEEERSREIEEIRQHLESLVQANRADGLTEDEAVAGAIRSFDEDRSVAVELSHARNRKRMRSLPAGVVVALFTWSIGLLISLVSFVTTRPIHMAILGQYFHGTAASYLLSATNGLGLISFTVLYFMLGKQGLWNEMRSIKTPWGAAVRWSLLHFLLGVPVNLIISLYIVQHLPVGGPADPSVLLWEFLGLTPSMLAAYLVGRSAPGKAFWGVVVAAILAPALQTITTLQQLVRNHTPLSEVPAIFLTSLLWLVLSAALPAVTAIVTGKQRLRRA